MHSIYSIARCRAGWVPCRPHRGAIVARDPSVHSSAARFVPRAAHNRPPSSVEATNGELINENPDRPAIEVHRIQHLQGEVIKGVAGVDRGESTLDLGTLAALLAGDGACFLLFAAVGRMQHGEGLAPLSLLGTAGPFLAAWYGTALLLGTYSRQELLRKPEQLFKTWAVGVPLGIGLHSLAKGHVPALSFVLVSLASTGAFLASWRAVYNALAGPMEAPARTPGEELRRRKDRKGGPLEFMQLLASLTQRW
ncbi:CGLD9 [Auxenochlorella protothecoides x Auxenochlorella symbiontica]